MIIQIGLQDHIGDMGRYGSSNESWGDKFCAFILAVSPILQHYKGPVQNAGFTVLLLIIPWLTLRFFTRLRGGYVERNCLIAVVPILLFEIYCAVVHPSGMMRMFYQFFMIWLFICIAGGTVNLKVFLRIAIAIVTVAAGLLLVQYASHYVLHRTINLRPFNLLVSESNIWVRHAERGLRAGALYRPAAFFLEPSHLFLYSFPILAVLLLSPGMTGWRKIRAIIITAAMVLSTSGMGIVAVIGLWGLYFLFYRNNEEKRAITLGKIFSPKTITIAVVLLIALGVAYFNVPIIARTINRILASTEGSSAIDGRIRLASHYITGISGVAVFFGQSNVVQELNFNLAGFFATYIKWGVFGLILSYWHYAQGLFRLKHAYFWISAIILVISFFTAHTHGTFYMVYYTVFLMNGYYESALAKEEETLPGAALQRRQV